MIDIHTHLIPGVDDGSQSEMESLRLLELAEEQGVTHVFMTPHNSAFDWYKNVEKGYDKLCEKLNTSQISISTSLGAEILCSKSSIRENIQRIKNKKYPTLNGTEYVLIEFNPFNPSAEDAILCVRSIIDSGYKPVIAHAERYEFSNMENMETLKNEGALIQINAYSLKDESQNKVKVLARELMRKQLVDFMGSDTHRLSHRPVMVSNGIKYAYSNFGKNYVDKVMYKNAIELLIGG